MDSTIRSLWLAALRSSEYIQIRDALHRQWLYPNMFCAFGVLCELHRRAFGGRWYGPDGRGAFYYLGQSVCCPLQVQEWAGLIPDAKFSILEWNKTLTFAEIADRIEAYLQACGAATQGAYGA
jgi:hypothetical protein